MLPGKRGSIRLFRFAGIDVFLHWSWFLIAFYQISYRGLGGNLQWNVLIYLALFAIVLMHEFGHALACRSVGGRADQIVLWPLGGVAYVDPPQRPGATLWSIAAGPLVNVILFPVLTVLSMVSRGWVSNPGLHNFLQVIWMINVGLLVFNLLPIYPLDGGKIVWSLLWFVCGRARSLMIAAGIGLAASALALLAVIYALVFGHNAFADEWLAIILVFALVQSWSGLSHARALARIAAAPPREGFACPVCHKPPPIGDFWICGQCRRSFDMFATQGICPGCGMSYNGTRCLECGTPFPLHAFQRQI